MRRADFGAVSRPNGMTVAAAIRTFVPALSSILALALPAAPASAQTRWDMPTPYVDGNFRTQNVRWFTDELREASNGRLHITDYDNASLFPMPERKGAVQSGRVNIVDFLLSAYGHEDPIFEAGPIPFLAAGL